MDVIVSDIDGTIVDVRERIRATLREIGEPFGEDVQRAADALRGSQRSRFFDLFLTEKFTHFDAPIPAVIEALDAARSRSGLPVVFLTGRPATMRKSSRKAIAAAGIEPHEIILRPKHHRMTRTTRFKVEALKDRGYHPRIVFDDDAEILAAIAAAFPNAELHLVSGDATTPWPE